MSKLIDKELLESLPALYETEGLLDPICDLKIFTPDVNWSWYIMEINKEDQDYCYGYVIGLESELGYFNLSEIEAVKGPLGLSVERDKFFEPTPFSKVKKIEDANRC